MTALETQLQDEDNGDKEHAERGQECPQCHNPGPAPSYEGPACDLCEGTGRVDLEMLYACKWCGAPINFARGQCRDCARNV